MSKKRTKYRSKSMVPKKTVRSLDVKNRPEEDISTTPAYRRAKTLVGIASTIGIAVIAFRATRRHFRGTDEDDEAQND